MFGYHFTAYDHYPFSHFYPNNNQFAGASSVETSTPSPDPILYEYRPTNTDEFDSFDISMNSLTQPNSPNNIDTFVVGVENMVFLSNIGSGQHLNVIIRQDSDGLQPEYIEKSESNADDYFPSNVEVRLHSNHIPNDAELSEINKLVQKFVKDHSLDPYL